MTGKSRSHKTARAQRERAFRAKLLRWFDKNARDLPWRRTRDPYRVLVSEVMLQQTQVARVEGYYERFLKAFPTLSALARAAPSRVREAWEGLGYYHRSDNLHALARQVMADHQGQIPDNPEALRALPGVGRYTAGAVLSFAFERPAAAVDTNVARVIRRAFLTNAGRSPRVERAIWALAERLLPRSGPRIWAFNQAIMELGALLCTARQAYCHACPVRTACLTGRRRTAPRGATVSGSGTSPKSPAPARRSGLKSSPKP